MRLKAILVGVGGRGKWAVEVLSADPKWQIAALVDTNPEFLSAAREATSLSERESFANLADALKAVDTDAVIACTPTHTHAPLGRLAFNAGKHFLVEKGMTLDWEEAKALVREAEAAGVKFCVAQNYRYNPVESAINNIIATPSHENNPGKIEIVDLIHHRYRPEPRTLNYPFAMVWDMSCHHVDLLNAWLGPASEVMAISSNPSWSAYEYDAGIAAIINYESGAVCHYVLTHAATISDYRLILQGNKGVLRAFDQPGLRYYPVPQSQLGSSQPIEVELPQRPRSEQGVADDFAKYITENIEPGISGRNNLKTLAVCEMMVRSAREKRSVKATELI